MRYPPPARLRRQPATAAFLARRVARIAWRDTPSPRLQLVETCRAELEWAVAEWRLQAGEADDRSPGPHPSEAWRLPHERAAARVVNCHLHVDVARWRLRDLMPMLRQQRAASLDGTQCAELRLYWADAAATTVREVRDCLARRRLAWHCFLAAGADYRTQRVLLACRSEPVAA